MSHVLVIAVALVAFVHTGTARSNSCYESTVLTPTPFLGNHGEILKLSDGSLWEVEGAYEYLYEYYPTVVICPSAGLLRVDDVTMHVRLLTRNVEPEKNGVAPSDVIDSFITSEFEGLNLGNVYRLANGQIWEQTEAWIWVWVWVNPTVLIYPTAGGYKMKVENIEHAVFVRRLK